MKSYQFAPTQATCPVCHGTTGHILWSVNSEQATQHYVLKDTDTQKFLKLSAHIQELWQQDTCDVVQCDDCGFCYSHPYVAGDSLFYTLAYERSHYPTWKWEHQLTYEALQNAGKNFKLLELGAGDGAFVKRVAPTLTSNENVLCTEYSDYGRKQIQDYGIQCLATDVREAAFASFSEYFDAICLFQVLEHMDQLDVLFERLNLITQPKASLFISVPNPPLVEFAELNGGLLDMPPNHIGRWNQQSFKTIGDRWGWAIEGYEIENNSFLDKAKLFSVYRFWRQGQQSGSLANQILQISNPQLQKLMKVFGVGVYALTALPILSKLAPAELGFSQWVHLRKTT